MDPELQSPLPDEPSTNAVADEPFATPAEGCVTPMLFRPVSESAAFRWLQWAFIGNQGLRAGWSMLIFSLIFVVLGEALAASFVKLHWITKKDDFTASAAFIGELVAFLALVAAAAVVARIERRSNLLAFNLDGPRPELHFFSGFVAGFAALSALVGALALGGWIHFGPIALTGVAIFKYGALWAAAFLLVGCVEEGIFRGYLQFTFTRGINFWWALGLVGVLCLSLILHSKGNGVWGVYLIALLGLLPCLLLHLRKTPRCGFWQAAWVTSTLFGFIHTGNGGENRIGIFAAALIGFVFCVSIRVTGSAWWAIGCHAAWDWAETYFYGTADSGLVASGHYLSTSPTGNTLWSGGADGPEGSLLVIGVILLLLAALIVLYGRGKSPALPLAMCNVEVA